jgi:tetratricopeptide (TPR) repeat protein
MSDPLRTETPGAFESADADREAKIEQLLLGGLEHYFAARYDQAINVWTRALFLDRSHARARAYIERARGALAERAREAEECLQDGVAAADRGDAAEAHRLLQSAIERGAGSDDSQRLVDRLTRLGQLEPAADAAGPPIVRRKIVPADPARSRASRTAWIAGVALVFVVLVAGIVLAGALRSDWNPLLDRPAMPATHGAGDEALAMPRRGEIAMARAQALAASGRLRDALTALDRVRPTDPQKPDADRLRAEVQRQLLGLAGASAAPPDSPATGQP